MHPARHPPRSPYLLRLPEGHQRTPFAQNLEQHLRLASGSPSGSTTVEAGDTLSQIALQYAPAPEAILQFNRLKSATHAAHQQRAGHPGARGARGGRRLGTALERRWRGRAAAAYVGAAPGGGDPRRDTHRARRWPRARSRPRSSTARRASRTACRSGDSLWTIAQRFNVTVDELRNWNELPRRKRGLQVGTMLRCGRGTPAAPQVQERAGTVVAATQPAQPTAAPAKLHTLAAGETLWSVAQRYGVTVEDIKRWNNIKDHRNIPAGKQLVVAAP